LAKINRVPLFLSIAGFTLLLASALLAGTASAAAIDLTWAWKPAEDTTCRVWPGAGTVTWNLTLAMSGTDGSLITTPTYVFIDDASIVGPRNDGWTFILAAGPPNPPTNPTSYDSNSNSFVSGNASYVPAGASGIMDLTLYSGSHVPPAPPANLSVFLLPSIASENKTWSFNLTAQTHRTGVTNVVKKISLCVVIPAHPKFYMATRRTPSRRRPTRPSPSTSGSRTSATRGTSTIAASTYRATTGSFSS